jgi:hypothetical protein
MKKTSSFIIVGLLLVLVGISVYIYSSKSKLSSVEEDSRNFKFKDTAAITRIFIADKDGNKSDLERTKNGWVVNGKYNCRGEAILNLLEVIKLVEVKMPVAKESKEGVIKYLASQAIKVEIFTGDKKVRQYYVGHETPDSEGSYMLLSDPESGKNFKDPYGCFIPGFIGYLQPRFIVNENDWRDRIVLNYTPPQLKRVSLRNLQTVADSSFTIDLAGINQFRLTDGKGANVPFEDEKMRQYLIYLQNISYEVLITGKDKKLQDSLLAAKPFIELAITTVDSKTETYKFYRKKFLGDINPEHGVKYDYDPDRLYLSFNNDKEWALIQYFVFGKLLVSPTYFVADKSVKK